MRGRRAYQLQTLKLPLFSSRGTRLLLGLHTSKQASVKNVWFYLHAKPYSLLSFVVAPNKRRPRTHKSQGHPPAYLLSEIGVGLQRW
jgi:hypothetical protein